MGSREDLKCSRKVLGMNFRNKLKTTSELALVQGDG